MTYSLNPRSDADAVRLAAEIDEFRRVATPSTLRVELREGDTLRAVRWLEPTVGGSGESTRWQMTLTQEERDSVVNWSNLQIWLVADGGARAIRVHRVRLVVAGQQDS